MDALEGATAGRVEYPPLEAWQCVLLMDKPLLWNHNATLWLDRLYLAVARTQVDSQFVMVQYGTHFVGDAVGGRAMYVTNTTFVGEGRGSARAIGTFEAGASVLLQGARVVVFHAWKDPPGVCGGSALGVCHVICSSNRPEWGSRRPGAN